MIEVVSKEPEHVAPEAWIEAALAERWPGSRCGQISALAGDASSRRFWRVTIEGRRRGAPETAIALDLGSDSRKIRTGGFRLFSPASHEPSYLNVHRFLESLGVAVPELYVARRGERMLLVEDVGERPLFDEALGSGDGAELYRRAVRELLRFHVDGTTRPDRRCVAFSREYNERLFHQELEQFVEFGLTELELGAEPRLLEPELAELARRLGSLPRVFSHRDYHGRNLFVQADHIRVLDFQDALMAPAAQDLAVLLTTRDASRVITPALEQRLLHYYLAGLAHRGAAHTNADRFMESYRLCVLQHALKVIGRFAYFARQGRTAYAAYIPYAVAQARRMLADRKDLPYLREAFEI
jgi:aminoglycoside/choline kinase family phosphotransferase